MTEKQDRRSEPGAAPEAGPGKWPFKLLAACLPLAVLVLIDLGLRLAGLVPPEDPLVFYSRSFQPAFSPFIEDDPGVLTIKPDWVSDGTSLRERHGKRAGQLFLLPGFRPCRIAREKPAGAIRIFALGGSTTFGFGVGAHEAFPAALERRLRARLPGRKVEVVNLGCPGWASGRVKNLLEVVLELEPDLIVVYSGHNEMLEGHFGSAPHLGARGKLAATALSLSPTYGWIHHLLAKRRHARDYEAIDEQAAAIAAGQTLVYDPLMIPAEERRPPPGELLDSAVSEYRANLRSMIDSARTAEVPLLFSLPVTNLVMPPAYSAHPDDFAETDEFQKLLDQTRTAFRDGRIDDALVDVDRAVELSPRYAMAHYWRGSVLRFRGEWRKALDAYQRAVDLDLRTHRMTSRFERVLIETAEEADVGWVDLRPIFHRDSTTPYAEELFVDFCHPTADGHQQIASRLVPIIVRIVAPASPENPESE
ncbi:MAG: hypothetical protein GY856_02520 [bacterium]|nr:hypothetical protein [bacterium]